MALRTKKVRGKRKELLMTMTHCTDGEGPLNAGGAVSLREGSENGKVAGEGYGGQSILARGGRIHKVGLLVTRSCWATNRSGRRGGGGGEPVGKTAIATTETER